VTSVTVLITLIHVLCVCVVLGVKPRALHCLTSAPPLIYPPSPCWIRSLPLPMDKNWFTNPILPGQTGKLIPSSKLDLKTFFGGWSSVGWEGMDALLSHC
jgi:hypothetical protein